MSANRNFDPARESVFATLEELRGEASKPWLTEGILDRLGRQLMKLEAAKFSSEEQDNLELSGVIRRLVSAEIFAAKVKTDLAILMNLIEGFAYPDQEEDAEVGEAANAWANEVENAIRQK